MAQPRRPAGTSETPAGWAAGGCRALRRKLTAGEFVVTAEMPTIDGGGFPEIQRQLAPMKAGSTP